jgi:hypothetical protein
VLRETHWTDASDGMDGYSCKKKLDQQRLISSQIVLTIPFFSRPGTTMPLLPRSRQWFLSQPRQNFEESSIAETYIMSDFYESPIRTNFRVSLQCQRYSLHGHFIQGTSEVHSSRSKCFYSRWSSIAKMTKASKTTACLMIMPRRENQNDDSL